ncbi:MAG: LysR family transcriptional regulator, partial [Burkholderiales bacterium]
MDNLHGILVFLNVADAGSLSGAARALGVTTAAVSGTISRLERNLSVRLLDRTTRRLNMTAEGAEFYARCKQIVADLDAAERAVTRTGREPSGLLRVGMPQGLGRMWIIPQLPLFRQRFPAITLEIICRDFVSQAQDSDLDISVRSGELQPSRLAARTLASCRYAVCASQDYFDRNGVPATPDDLARHTCLAYRRPRNGRVRQWRFADGRDTRNVAVSAKMTFNSNEALVAAAGAGLGLIQVADYYVRPALAAGELVEVMTRHKTGGYEISVLFPQQQHVAPKHRVFVDFLVSIFSQPPWTRPA